MMQVAASSSLFGISKSATAKLKMKMKMLPSGFSSAIPSSSLAIDKVIGVIVDFVVDAVDVVDVSVSGFEDVQVAASSSLFGISKSATAKLKMKMKMLPSGFSSAIPSSSLAIDKVIGVIVDFVVDAVDVVDVSVSGFGLFPQDEHLVFSGIVLVHRQILIEEVLEAHQHSNEEPNVWRL